MIKCESDGAAAYHNQYEKQANGCRCYSRAALTFTPVGVGWRFCTRVGTCSPCVAGKYKIASGDAACSNSLAGQYSTAVGATSDVCQGCPTNTHAPEASNQEIDCTCNAGWTGPHGEMCTECIAGSYKTSSGNADCDNCPENSDSPAGSTASTACTCDAGWTGPNGGTCTECVEGKYKSGGGNANGDSCPTNSDSPAGSNSVTTCTCNAGSSGPAGGGTCTECVAGKYKAVARTEACNNCGMGKYSVTIGAITSTTCANTCPAQSTSPIASGHITHCSCNQGYYGANGDICSSCSGGTFKSTQGISSCLSCPSDSDSSGASVDVTGCECNQGYLGANGDTCSPCPTGTYKTEKGVANCVNCPSGTYSTTLAATSTAMCLACPPGSTSPEQSTTEVDCVCDPGFSGPDGGLCSICDCGKYKQGSGEATCLNCPDEGGDKQTSPPGSTSSDVCSLSCAAGSFEPDRGPCTRSPSQRPCCVRFQLQICMVNQI